MKSLLFLHGVLLLYAMVSVFAKLAGIQMSLHNLPMTLWMLGAEVAVLAVYSVLWQQVLKRMPLSFAYSNKGVCTLWTCLFGLAFFGESLSWGKALGIAVVLLGVGLVVTDRE